VSLAVGGSRGFRGDRAYVYLPLSLTRWELLIFFFLHFFLVFIIISGWWSWEYLSWLFRARSAGIRLVRVFFLGWMFGREGWGLDTY
jgi:hypothetical protein